MIVDRAYEVLRQKGKIRNGEYVEMRENRMMEMDDSIREL